VIPRYAREPLRRLWSDEERLSTWLEVELLACEGWARLGVVPAEAARRLRRRAADLTIDAAFARRVAEIERETRHDVIAFTIALAESLGEDARYIHYGLTSSDVLDTAQAVLMRRAADILLEGIAGLRAALARRAREHRDTPCVGRTHGVHAEPTTFGLKLALHYAEAGRNRDRIAAARDNISCGKISGAVGTYDHVPPEVEAFVCERLGLEPAPVSSQVLQRDRHAEYLCALGICAASLDKLATEIRGLARTETGEVQEPFHRGQKGSSAMPHKRNPVLCERISGLARVVKGNVFVGLDNVTLWHERDISHSSAERVVVPDSTTLLDFMLVQAAYVIDNMVVFPQRMQQNLELSAGLLASGGLMLDLVERGWNREDAYRAVQGHAQRARDTGRPLLDLVLNDRELLAALGEEAVRRRLETAGGLGYAEHIFARLGLDEQEPTT